MNEKAHPIYELLQKDKRYTLEAYHFVHDSLSYAQNVLHLGKSRTIADSEVPELAALDSSSAKEKGSMPNRECHLTGQELCEAIRLYSLDQYGFMAKTVLNSWGLKTTGDFGEIVYNLIGASLMKKSESDQRTDFDDCYEFDTAFREEFRITADEK